MISWIRTTVNAGIHAVYIDESHRRFSKVCEEVSGWFQIWKGTILLDVLTFRLSVTFFQPDNKVILETISLGSVIRDKVSLV